MPANRRQSAVDRASEVAASRAPPRREPFSMIAPNDVANLPGHIDEEEELS